MENLYHQTNRLIQDTQQCFQHLNSNQPVEVTQIENEIETKIANVNANCDRLDVMLFKVPVAQRPNAKMRVDQLKYDIRHLQAALSMWQQKRQRKQMEISDREQLLSTRFRANSETMIDMDYSINHNDSMNSAHRGVDEMISTGNNVLENLRSQRDTIKGAHKRLLDLGNTLGLSNQTMKMIERRVAEDKWVMIGGMCVTLLIIVIVIYYFVL